MERLHRHHLHYVVLDSIILTDIRKLFQVILMDVLNNANWASMQLVGCIVRQMDVQNVQQVHIALQ